jgi:hypothetical protein
MFIGATFRCIMARGWKIADHNPSVRKLPECAQTDHEELRYMPELLDCESVQIKLRACQQPFVDCRRSCIEAAELHLI